MKPKSRLNWFPAAGACLITVCIQAVHADTGWTGAIDANFNNAANWDNGAPTGTNAYINTTADNIATISADAGTMNEIFVARGGNTGLLRHSAGTASTAGWMDVGTAGGTGTYNLTATTTAAPGTLTGFDIGSGSMSVGGQLYVGGAGFNNDGGSGTVNINTTNALTVAGDIYVGKSGTGVINMDAGALNRTGGWTVIGRNAGGNGAFNMSGGTVTAAGDTVIGLSAGSTGALNMTGGTYTTGGQMQIGRDGGNGTVNIGGAGTLTANSWLVLGTGTGGGTGTLEMTGGTVNANSWMYVGDGAGNSGTLDMSGGTVNANSWLFVGNGGSGTLNMSGGTVNAIDYTVIGKNTGGAGTLNISGSGTFNTNGGLVVGGDGGTGTLNMTGGTVNQGTTNAGSRLELTNGGSTGNATVNLDGGTLAVNGIVANGTGAGTVLLNLNGGTLKANISNNDFINDGEIDRINVRNDGAVIDTDGENIRIANAILHSDIGGDNATDGGLTKNGAGKLTLTNANTYSGGTTVSAGTIEANNNTALGSGDVSIAEGASVLFNADDLTIANNFTLNGTTSGGALVSGDRSQNNVTTLSGTITLADDSNIASWWNDKRLTLSGKITGSGDLTFDRATSLGNPVGGKFLISGTTNDYTGSTTVNGVSGGNAILQLGATNALPTGTTLTLNDATLSLLGFNQTLGGLVASTTTSRIVNGSATAVTLTVNNAAANTFAGVLGGGGTDENNFALTKDGAGTLTLSGANTYTGATTINEGTLKLAAAGSINNTSGVSLGSGGIFDVSEKDGYTVSNLTGSGTVIGALTVSTTLAIGNSPGTTDFSDLTLGSASTYSYELDSSEDIADLGNVDGNLTINVGAALDLVQLGAYDLGDKFTLFSYSGTQSGIFEDHDDDTTFTAGGGMWVINYDDTDAGSNGGSFSNFVTITAVPEPGAAMIGGLGILALLRRRTRR